MAGAEISAGAGPAAADPLAGLVDIRGPVPTVDRIAADGAAAFSAGLALAVVAAVLWRVLTRPEPTARDRALAALSAARRLPPEERVAAMARAVTDLAAAKGGRSSPISSAEGRARLAAVLGSDWFAGPEAARLAGALYRHDPGLDLDAVERRLGGILRRVAP